MVNPLPTERDGRLDIARHIVDKHHFTGLDIRQMNTHLAKACVIDRRIRLDQLQFAGHHDVAKMLQERIVGSGIRKGFKDRHTVRQRAAQHFMPAVVIGLDQRLMLGILLDQAASALGQGAAGVLLGVPGLGADILEKPLPFVVVGNQLAVEVLRTPVEQDTAEIKNYCTNRHQILR
ncbi:hypothetical protein BHE74_00000177 [Ensete ventricosum]|nr:hypothetical protein BHE74_00000177 [Ensete ventricosum]